MIKVIGKPLAQWDLGRSIRVVVDDGQTITHVDFANKGDRAGLTVKVTEDDGGYVAKIPNIYLQSSKDIIAHAIYEEGETRITVESRALPVQDREKPAGYVYTETEVYTVSAMFNDALAKAKESGDFKGEPGRTPVKGEDYYTEEDKEELVNEISGKVLTAEGAVLYTAQEMDADLQAQARANIDAASGAELERQKTNGDELYAITHSVNQGASYAGYASPNLHRVYVDIPANTEFEVVVETINENGGKCFVAFHDFYLMARTKGTTSFSSIYSSGGKSVTIKANKRGIHSYRHDITALGIRVDAADAKYSGNYTLKVRIPHSGTIGRSIENLELGKTEDADILKLNPENEMLPLFQNAKVSLEYDHSYGRHRSHCLVLAHTSDIHGDGENLGRIVRFADKYSDYIDEVISTGDIVWEYADEDFNWWTKNGGSRVLVTVGNHDVETSTSLRGLSKTDAYTKYFAPHIENWEVTQPNDAATNGKCYYYKDYTIQGPRVEQDGEKVQTTNTIRLIALDCMYYDDAQRTWFGEILTDAKNKGYPVIVMAHSIGKPGTNIDCTYSAINKSDPGAVISDTTDANGVEYYYCRDMHKQVDDFIRDDGDGRGCGKFVCFLGGHYHRNMFGTVDITDADDPTVVRKQPYFLGVCAGTNSPNRIHQCIKGTRSQDSFNIVSIDPYLELIKIFPVGYQYDNYMRRIGTLCYDYANHKMIYNG